MESTGSEQFRYHRGRGNVERLTVDIYGGRWWLERGVQVEVVCEAGVRDDATQCVFADSFFEEIGFSLEACHDHEREQVICATAFGLLQFGEQSVSTELDALGHEHGVHSDESTWECKGCEFALKVHCILDDHMHGHGCCWAVELLVQEAHKIAVQALIVANELIRLAQSRQHSTLFDPADGAET